MSTGTWIGGRMVPADPPPDTSPTVPVQPVAGWQLVIDAAPIDPCRIVAPVTVQRGEPQPGAVDPVSPSAALFTLRIPTSEDPPPIGAAVTFDAPGHGRRFTGRLWQASTTWESGQLYVMRCTAVGVLTDAARRFVGDEPWPTELEGDRIGRILTLAGLTASARRDAGTIDVLARDVDRQPALELCREYATAGHGRLFDTAAGTVTYLDAAAASVGDPAAELDACDLLADVQLDTDAAAIRNAVTVEYGPQDDIGNRAAVSDSDPSSIGRYGYADAGRIDLPIATADHAADHAFRVLSRASQPWPDLPLLHTGTGICDPGTLATLLAAEPGTVLRLTGLPAPLPATLDVVLEGWRETWTDHGVTLALHVTDGRWRGRGWRWIDSPDALRWQDVDPAITWADAAGYLPPGYGSRGRWADVASSETWTAAAGSWPDR